MKKALVILLACMLMLTFAACGGSGGDASTASSGATSSADASTPVEEPADDPAGDGELITVGFVQTNTNESDWRTANTASMQEALTPDAGFDLKIVYGEGSHEKQVADAQALIQEEVDYLVIAGIQSSGWESVAQSASDAGIPLIMVDRKLELSEDQYTAMVCSDFEAEGVKATDWLKAQNLGEYNILHIQGDAGSSAQLGRSKALEDAAAANGWNIVHQQAMKGWDEGLATQEVTNVIDAGTSFNVVFSENDNMARGAETAMDNAGITYGKDGDVKVIAFDANRWALQLVADGKFNLDVECNPLHGPRIVQLINALEAGETVDKNAYVDEAMFDADTITQDVVDARPY